MYVSEAVLEPKCLKTIKFKVKMATFFTVLFSLAILGGIATIIISAINGISNFNAYLMSTLAILFGVYWIYLALKTQKANIAVINEIEQNGFYISKGLFEVNPKHKYNIFSIVMLVLGIIVLAIFGFSLLMQIINFSPESLFTLPMLFVLAIYTLYYAIGSMSDDKILRKVIYE